MNIANEWKEYKILDMADGQSGPQDGRGYSRW